jgi:hypothetical protein
MPICIVFGWTSPADNVPLDDVCSARRCYRTNNYDLCVDKAGMNIWRVLSGGCALPRLIFDWSHWRKTADDGRKFFADTCADFHNFSTLCCKLGSSAPIPILLIPLLITPGFSCSTPSKWPISGAEPDSPWLFVLDCLAKRLRGGRVYCCSSVNTVVLHPVLWLHREAIVSCAPVLITHRSAYPHALYNRQLIARCAQIQ